MEIITLFDKIKLFLIGKVITKNYTFFMCENRFKEKVLSNIMIDKTPTFSESNEYFTGSFTGKNGREIILKPKKSFFTKDSLSNSIWIKGKIEPISERRINLNVIYNRTNYLKFGIWTITGFFFLFLSLIFSRTYKNLEASDLTQIGIGTFFLFGLFYLVIFLQMSNQIRFFKKYFISEFYKEKHEN